jgi:hypothetical protein
MYDRKGYRYQITRPVDGGRLVDLGRRSRRNLVLTLKIDSLGGSSQTASPKLRPHPKPGRILRISGRPIRTMRYGLRLLGNKQGFRKEFYECSLPSPEPSLPHSTWLYWSEFGSTMGALPCPEGGKTGVYGVGSSKLGRKPN